MTLATITMATETTPATYTIRVGPRACSQINSVLSELSARDILLITDHNVAKLHLAAVLRHIAAPHTVAQIAPGEASKSLATLQMLYDRCAAAGLTRSDAVLALGGGVVGDLAGFLAATWLRGIRFIQVPTTLEAAIDASIGGKTGVNHPRGKNLIGAFHQPAAVIIDTDFLATLPDRELRAGLAESVKHALIRDADFLAWHERQIDAVLARDPDATAELIARNCRIKAAVVAADEREAGLRMILNFGHTVGHALEHLLEYELRHGECVAIGMFAALRISHVRGHITAAEVDRVQRLLERIGLPIRPPRPIDPAAVLAVIRQDKKHVGGKLHFVLLERVGDAVTTTDVSDADIAAALA